MTDEELQALTSEVRVGLANFEGCTIISIFYNEVEAMLDAIARLTRERDEARALLREANDNGLIYWEPRTTKGHIAKADMQSRINRALAAKEGGDE